MARHHETYCKHCGSTLGIDCGEAEPDYNEHYCSKGCFKAALEEILFSGVDDKSRHKFVFEI